MAKYSVHVVATPRLSPRRTTLVRSTILLVAIEQHNISYQHVNDLESMLTTCFRRPETNELVLPLLTRDIVGILSRSFPEIQRTQGMNIKVGRLLKAMNFERKENAQGTVYYLVPIVSAA